MKNPSEKATTPQPPVEIPDPVPVNPPGLPPVEMPPLPREVETEPGYVTPMPVVGVEFPVQPHDHGMSHPMMGGKSRKGNTQPRA